jgi:hypothetical protein
MDRDSSVRQWAGWLVQHRTALAIASLVVAVLAASGMRFLTFTNDYRAFFSTDNPQLLAFEALEKTYTKVDNVMIAVAPRDGQVFTPMSLAATKRLTDAAWKLPHAIRVDSITNFQHTYARGDELIVQDLVPDTRNLSAGVLARIRDTALREPLLVNRLVSAKADVSAVNVTVQLPGKNSLTEVPAVANAARALAASLEKEFPEVKTYLTGMVMINNAFVEASQQDMATLVPAMFAIIILSMGFLLRSFAGTFASVSIILFTIVAAMGITGWLGSIKITPASASAPTIILTLVVANTVHILTSFLHALRQGLDKAEALTESLRINLEPVFLTNITTVIGFLSLNFSEVPPYRDLGNIVAIGVVAGYVLTMTLLPALVMWLPIRVQANHHRESRAMERLGDFVVRRRRALLWGTAVLIVLLGSLIPLNRLNDDFVKYFDTRFDFRVATDFINKNLTGFQAFEYSLSSGEAGGISDPEFLRTVEAFTAWYRQQPETRHVNSITDIIKRLNRNLHGDDPRYYRIPGDRELAAQYLLLYEMSLPYGLDLNNQISVDKSATRFTVLVDDLPRNALIALEDRAAEWLRQYAPASMQQPLSGPGPMFNHISERNVRSLLIGSLLALVLISMILVLALRSVRIGLMSMLPNVLPVALAFGLWGLFIGEIGMSIAPVIGMTLGIVVDDTIHFLSKYLRARREKRLSPADAVRYAFASVGTAMWVTSFVLVAGFLVLTFSGFQLNSWMGLITAITIALALAADFLFLPPLLMKIEEKNHEQSTVAAVESARA